MPGGEVGVAKRDTTGGDGKWNPHFSFSKLNE